jgi:hypothetical protein
MARPDQSIRSLYLNDTDPTGSGWNKITTMTEGWNIDASFLCDFKDRHSAIAFHFNIVYMYFYVIHLPHQQFFFLDPMVYRFFYYGLYTPIVEKRSCMSNEKNTKKKRRLYKQRFELFAFRY